MTHEQIEKRHDFRGVGGCAENPGVWDTANGGMRFVSECSRCGLHVEERVDYTGHRPGNTSAPVYSREGQRVTMREAATC